MSTKLEDYEVLNIIGSGTFGTCYKVRNVHTKEYFVWKAIDYGNMSEENKQLLVSEVNLLSELNHPNIVKYYNRIIQKETATIYIIMEWCKGGDLATHIKQNKKANTCFEEGFVWHILYQTGRALQVCHTKLGQVTVLHRDIKPANVFLDENGNVKLGDFGLARILQGKETHSQTMVGTPYYMSPEVMKGAKYNKKSDIWALGCLVYELCALAPPFDGLDIHELANNVKLGRYNHIPQHYSENLVKIIRLMLTVKYEFRPTIEMILHHPIVVSNITKFKKGKCLSESNKSKQSEIKIFEEKNLTTGIKDVSLSEKDPWEVSEKKFKEKWLSRLETIRRKEAKLREKEEALERRERLILKREKQVVLMEREAKEKISRAEVYLHQCKENKIPLSKFDTIKDESSFSADPGDSSIEQHTTARIDPLSIPKPCFTKRSMDRKDKRVHFVNGAIKSSESILKLDNRVNIARSVQDNKAPPIEFVFSENGIAERKLTTKEQEIWSEHNKILNYGTKKYFDRANNEKENKTEKAKGKKGSKTRIIL